MTRENKILAQRLGKTVHVSPLQLKLLRLSERFPVEDAACLEDWLIELANTRGARIVIRNSDRQQAYVFPDKESLSDEELVIGICLLQCLDRPQMLRLAAQFISRGKMDFHRLKHLADRERVGPILKELANQALHVDVTHQLWRKLHTAFQHEKPLKSPILHWTRLADPVMKNGRCNAESWRLVS